jgi:hypothetical protein
MKRSLCALSSVFALVLAPLSAAASFHLWDITEVYSNADGSVQFVELFDPFNGEGFTAGEFLKSNSTTYTVPTNLDPDAIGNPNPNTANHYMLFATPAFASQLGAVQPDFVLPAANFLSTVADTINWANVDTFTYGAGVLPTDGLHSLNEPWGGDARTVALNSPTNFHGQVGSVPEPSTGALVLLGLLGLRVRRS